MNEQIRQREIQRVEAAMSQSAEPPLAWIKLWLQLKFGLPPRTA